ncbi:MAG: DUF1829 domain-containing protein [Candidatus Omnitrophica bacterium]|nr:DUF1829 domain-containing protein [Candidatus Omnitrophota bacterium]MBU4479340.1 DUF1829 domain-containing protein [Candidatus Omnitrophota bacterium]MCG2704222.1 DUF1829 domain-containing protein [Candidatus Omnitrophota bacterium]
MIHEIQDLLDQYLRWLKDKTVLRQIKDWVEITTPYIDRHNDYLQIYVKKDSSEFVLTDDGYTIGDLRQSGCELESKKRKELLMLTLNGFGVNVENDALVIHASVDNFSLRKHNLVQAMLAVNDLFYLSVPMVTSLFLEDVTSWLNVYDVRYTPRVKFTGKTGYDHMFDFVIPASRRYPERILQTINRPNRNTAERFAFSWIDTKDVRPANSLAYAFLNDSDHTPISTVVDALKNYGVKPLLWTKREEFKEELVA